MTRAADLAKLIAGGGTITVADNSENLKLVTTDADANVGPTLRMDRQSASAADGDLLGKVNFVGHNDAGTPEDIAYAGITAIINDSTDGEEDGKLAINTIVAGSEVSRIFIDAGETVFNENGVNVDFRVESDGLTNAFLIDAGNNGIGFGISPRSDLHTSATQMFLGLDGGIISQRDSGLGINGVSLTQNTYIDSDTGNYAYMNTDEASKIHLNDGSIRFDNAASGTAGNAITFSERMRINTTGQVLIGTSSSLYSSTQKDGLQIEGAGGGPFVIVCKNVDTSGGANQILFQDGSGDTCGEIASNATNNTTSYGTSSDYRLKENITDVTNAISTLKKLKPKTYNFISDPDNISEDGFLAHELGAVVPNAVTGEKDDMTPDNKIKPQQVDYGRLTPLLTAALQEAVAKIETLEAKVTALEGK